MTFHIVIGRLAFDDEDTVIIVETDDATYAQAEAERQLRETHTIEVAEEEQAAGDDIGDEPLPFYVSYIVRTETEVRPTIVWDMWVGGTLSNQKGQRP